MVEPQPPENALESRAEPPRIVDHLISDCLAFLIPCFMFLEVDLVGRLFVPEVILAFILPVLLLNRGKMLAAPQAKRIIILGLLWLFSQIVTDIIRESPFEDYSRGWSKIAFLLCNFASIYLLLGINRRRILLFAVGWTIGEILTFFFDPGLYAADQPWKFGLAIPVTQLVVLLSMTKVFARTKFVPSALLVVMAWVHLTANARSLAGICFITAIYLLVQQVLTRKSVRARPPGLRTSIGVFVVLAISGVILSYTYGDLASSGSLGAFAQTKYENQSGGEFGILIGGRPETIVAVQAILDSPIIGHGSWAKDKHYIDLLRNLQQFGYKDRTYGDLASAYELNLIPTHSHLLGAWVEAGVVGAIFWVAVLWLVYSAIARLCFVREPLTPLIAFFGISIFWDILFSPFGADRRVSVSYVIVMFIYAHAAIKFQEGRNPTARDVQPKQGLPPDAVYAPAQITTV